MRNLGQIIVLFAYLLAPSFVGAYDVGLEYSYINMELPTGPDGPPLDIKGSVYTLGVSQYFTPYYLVGVKTSYVHLSVVQDDRITGLGETKLTQRARLIDGTGNKSDVSLFAHLDFGIPTNQFSADGDVAERVLDRGNGTGFSVGIGPSVVVRHKKSAVSSVAWMTTFQQDDRFEYYYSPTRERTDSTPRALNPQDSCDYNGCKEDVRRQPGVANNLRLSHFRLLTQRLRGGLVYSFNHVGRAKYRSKNLSPAALDKMSGESRSKSQLLTAAFSFSPSTERDSLAITGKATQTVSSSNAPDSFFYSFGFGLPF